MSTLARMALLISLPMSLQLLTERAVAAIEDEAPVIKVIKATKNSALVVFSKKSRPLEEGEVGRFVLGVPGENLNVEMPSRNNIIGVDLGFSMLETKADSGGESVKLDRFDMSLLYGWNKETFEYGALLGYSFEKGKDTDAKTLEIGGLLDFNFTPNNIKNDSVFGLRAIVAVGQQDNSAQSAAAATTRIEPGVFFKWFGFSTNLAAITTVSYRIASVSLESSKSTTKGVVGRLGIQAYF